MNNSAFIRPIGRMMRGIFLFATLCMLPALVCAQGGFANRTLQDIAEQLPDFPKQNVVTSEVIIPKVSVKRPVVIERYADGTVSHIGFKLFDRSIMEKHSTPLYHFLERYMLGLMLLESDMDIYTRLKMDHVKIVSEIHPEAPLKAGLQKVVSDDTSNNSIYITSNGKEYTVSCIKNEKLHVQITFPMRHELISGYTKVEAERAFYPQLMAFLASDAEEEEDFVSQYDMEPYKEGLFCAFKESYWLDDMASTSYYKKVGEEYVPLFDAQHTAESVFNLFNASHKFGVVAEITQSLYGQDNKISFEVPVCELTRYMRSQNCRVYTGIKKSKGAEIQLTVMAVNAEFGYQHLFSCSLDKRMLSNPKGDYKVKAKMYCFIPTHNISSLLGE